MDKRSLKEFLQENLEVVEAWKNNKHIFDFLILPGNPYEFTFIDDFKDLLFFNEPIHKSHTTDMFDILVEAGVFKSKSDAKKNWTKSDKEIEFGLSSWIVGKKRIPINIFKVKNETLDISTN